MAVANLGSISTRILNQIGSVPNSISGAELNAIVYDTVLFMQDFTGLSIGSVNIAERFQPALLNLSIAATLKAVDSQNGNVSSYSLDTFSISKNLGGDSITSSFHNDGMEQLKRIGRKFACYRAFG